MTRYSEKVALITGGTGFVGSNIARRLIKEGWQVHIIAVPRDNYALIRDFFDAVTVHEHDGTTERMYDIIAAVKPSIVFHLASLFLAQHEAKDIQQLIQSNILFGTQLVDAMIAHGVNRLVNTGTSWQHYKSMPYNPVCLYAATKQAFEAILEFYVEMAPLRAVTLKLFDTYGPHDPRPKLFTLLRSAILERKPLAMSPGEQLIDLVYIDDVVDAFLLAANRLEWNEVIGHEAYGVSSERPISLKELVTIYCRVTGADISVEWGGRPYRPREVMVPWKAGKSLPGWRPKVGLEDGLRRMEQL